ncbi:MAG: DUF3306 domain-containing protein [Alphaproteobacteria bacterium]
MTEESRLARWSRLKAKSRPKGRGIFFAPPAPEQGGETETGAVGATSPPAEAVPADAAPDLQPAEAVAASETAETEQDASPEEDAYPEDLPSIESLTKDSDFTAFMSDRVSDAIRNAALRKLWVSNPALANLDGLIDYGEDLTGSFKVVDNMQSVYKVGRGMVDYEAEAKLAEEKALEKEAAAPPPDAESADDNATEDEAGIEQTGSEDQDQESPDESSPGQLAADVNEDVQTDAEQVAENRKTPVSKS